MRKQIFAASVAVVVVVMTCTSANAFGRRCRAPSCCGPRFDDREDKWCVYTTDENGIESLDNCYPTEDDAKRRAHALGCPGFMIYRLVWDSRHGCWRYCVEWVGPWKCSRGAPSSCRIVHYRL